MYPKNNIGPKHLLTKGMDVLPQVLVKTLNHKFRIHAFQIALQIAKQRCWDAC